MKDLIYRILAKLYPMNLIEKLAYYKYVIQSYRISSRLGACGKGTRFSKVEYLTGHQHIHVGKNTIFLPHLFLTAWGEYDDSIKISIGDYSSIGAYCHVSAQLRMSVDSPPGMLTEDHHHTVHEERQVCYSSHLRPKSLHL